MKPGQIVILNGAPRSGKSSIARAMQERLPGLWLNLGVDAMATITPARLSPGIGLRPGGERPDLEPAIGGLYAALYEAIAAVSRSGINVVADLGHHESYSHPTDILRGCARRLSGLPALFVGVMAPIETIMRRRAESEGSYVRGTAGDPVPAPVARWQEAVHAHPVAYDLTADTSRMTPEECADAIAATMAKPPRPSAFERLAS
jgi:chloramphenicol 3-O phosphotransferase